MAGNSINQQLQAGITAAKSGNKALARQLLEGVLAQDERSELAWIWLATVVDTVQERRICLQRVLSINPNNQRARQALTELGGAAPVSNAAAARIAASTGSNTPRTVLYIVGISLLVLVVISVVSSLTGNQVVAGVANTNTPLPPGVLTNLYTPTTLPTQAANIVLVTPRPAVLPPTFTPTPTETPLPILFPTATPFPLAQYRLFYSARDADQTTPSLYSSLADGSNEQKIADNVGDFAFDLTGQQIVFVREVPITGSADAPTAVIPTDSRVDEIFVASLTDLNTARQVTKLGQASASSPSFSPDGRTIVFVSDYTGNDEIFLLDLSSGATTQLTDNDSSDRDPSWSPNGTSLVFASDRESPLYSDLYILTLNPDGTTRTDRLTNDTGSSYAPQFAPDGKRVVYVNDTDLYVIGSDGQRRATLVTDRFETRAPIWSPDGRFVAFISNREDDHFQMYFVEPPQRPVVRVNRDAREVGSVQYQPDLIFRIIGQNN